MDNRTNLERKLDARNVDKSSYRIIRDPAVLADVLARYPFETRTRINIADYSAEQLCAVVEGHLAPDEIYVVWWDYGGGAIRLSGAALAAQINDLWRPSSDDIVVFDEALRPILMIHHEEYLLIP